MAKQTKKCRYIGDRTNSNFKAMLQLLNTPRSLSGFTYRHSWGVGNKGLKLQCLVY